MVFVRLGVLSAVLLLAGACTTGDTQASGDAPPSDAGDVTSPVEEPELAPEPADEIGFIYDQDTLRSVGRRLS